MTKQSKKLLPLISIFPLLFSYGLATETPKTPKLQKEFEQSKQKEQSEFYGEPNGVQSNLFTTKTSCILQSDFKNKSQEELKQILLIKAKAEAIEEIYGTFMNTKSELKNGKLINDEIKQIASGLVRIKGNAKYFNGDNLGEICTTITAYATENDLKKYENAMNEIQSNPKNDTPQENIFTENGILAYFYDKDDLALANPLHQAIIKNNFNLANTPFTNKILKADKIYRVVLSGFIKSNEQKTITIKMDADVYDFSLFINEELITQTNAKPIEINLKAGYNSLKVIARTADSYDIAINKVDMKKRKETPLELTELYYDTSKVKNYSN